MLKYSGMYRVNADFSFVGVHLGGCCSGLPVLAHSSSVTAEQSWISVSVYHCDLVGLFLWHNVLSKLTCLKLLWHSMELKKSFFFLGDHCRLSRVSVGDLFPRVSRIHSWAKRGFLGRTEGKGQSAYCIFSKCLEIELCFTSCCWAALKFFCVFLSSW